MKYLATALMGISLVLSASAYDYTDNLAPSQNPPGDVPVDEAPMFISIGFDDNYRTGILLDEGQGMTWSMDFARALENPEGSGQEETFDGAPVRFTYYSNTGYWSGDLSSDYATHYKWIHNRAHEEGHEVGSHTHMHGHGESYSRDKWYDEIATTIEWFTKPAPEELSLIDDPEEGAGLPRTDITGYRTPFLEYNDDLFGVLKDLDFHYDCSIEEGWQQDQDGTDYLWPYTMDNGSPGFTAIQDVLGAKQDISLSDHPGMWQMPCYAIIAPPDDKCEQYGIEPGLRDNIASWFGGFNPDNGKMTGLDVNWFIYNGYRLTKEEALASLKYTLDLRMQGNRAPLLFGGHTNVYSQSWNGAADRGAKTPEERMYVIEEFITYALETYDEVRIVPMDDVLAWMRNPVSLEGNTSVAVPDTPDAAVFSLSAGNRAVQINSEITTQAVVSVYTAQGRQLFNGSRRLVQGSNTIPLERGHSEGVLFVRITGANIDATQKLLR
ncbi:MAG: hypothetical protein ACQEQ4_03640 [Fibrobacterota bacterium]